MLYWLLLLVIIILSFFIKKNSRFYLLSALLIFGGGAVLRVIGMSGIAEFFMRVSFIYWFIGLGLAFKELHPPEVP